ncbi:uncharacterized protein LOC132917281 [Rhopalosiphum padi]|uniref:uncharacterized protein LOC132917281 n=1 Tax=Rhopalosiphum padi TaxID=40932 RepID=UPI00298E895B|nr:uncharacterized protein LOC132917281 [Rhopalosiphum padi]XP_060833932.1 uncharacterized protein LOC132917281 [Rhopalosiphum padi]XP_060833933.1 uncharacterized protein LOC132917281 [Rhopalosiphum padi]XP_060833934.1 uncharacterized protein LOC132917281 [Rhopalosiphum padi]
MQTDGGEQPAAGGDDVSKVSRDRDTPTAAVTVWSRTKRALSSIHVEPLVCCYIVSRTLMLLATQNLSLQKACSVNLRLDNGTCAALLVKSKKNATAPLDRQEVATQRLVADMLLWQLIVQSAVPCALAVFVGSWSDRRRKRVPCMLVPVASELVRVVGLVACVYWFRELPMEVVGVIEAVPTSLAGGRMVLFNALFSYVGDVTGEELKTLRIGIVNLLSTVGMAIGTALSGITFQKLGFYGVYGTSSALCVIGLLYGLVFIKEVSPNELDNKTKTQNNGVLNGFFNAKHIQEAFKVTFKDGPHNRKLRIIMLMCIAFLIMGPLNGDLSVSYLNTRARFNWNEVDFSVFSTFSMVTNVAGTAICIGLFSHILKIDDSLIGVMACAGKIVAGICYALATEEWVYYLGPLVDIMGGTIFITARSIMSKIVKPDELGQVTAIYGIVESLVPIVFGPLYTVIYKNTVDTLPGAYSLVGSALAIPATIIYLRMYKESKLSKKNDDTSDKVQDDKL